jgi:GAF domain-containing protein
LINQDYARRSEELGVVRFIPSQYDISRNSWLGVPIQVGEQVIGMVCVMNLERENAFTESDVRLLTTIAANVGIAIQNAQLFTTVQQELAERKRAEEKIRQSADQLMMLAEIGRAVSEVTDLKSVLELIRQQLAKLLEFDSYSVRMFNEIERTVTYLAVYENGRYWDEPESRLNPDTHAYKVFETGESILHLMTDKDLEKYGKGLYTPIGDHSKLTTSLIFVPLKKQAQTIGAISLQRYEPNSYTLDHLHLVEAVAVQVAIAIENARLFESLQRELQERTRAEEIREKLIAELEQKKYRARKVYLHGLARSAQPHSDDQGLSWHVKQRHAG